LQDTHDCSQQLSREHYISEAVLLQIDKTLRVSGMPWQQPGEALTTGVGSLTAKILCQRHNNALSPLDAEAGIFFSHLKDVLTELRRKTLSRRPTFRLASGEALELWMLKVACGFYFAVGAKEGVRLSTTHTIDMAKVQRAFFARGWDERAGLYLRGAPGTTFTAANRARFSPLSLDHEARFSGVMASLLGFDMELLFDTKGTNPRPWSGLVRRPSELVFKKANRLHSIILTWPPGTPLAGVAMGPPTRTRTPSAQATE
jgi:hypothetical protein